MVPCGSLYIARVLLETTTSGYCKCFADLCGLAMTSGAAVVPGQDGHETSIDELALPNLGKDGILLCNNLHKVHLLHNMTREMA